MPSLIIFSALLGTGIFGWLQMSGNNVVAWQFASPTPTVTMLPSATPTATPIPTANGNQVVGVLYANNYYSFATQCYEGPGAINSAAFLEGKGPHDTVYILSRGELVVVIAKELAQPYAVPEQTLILGCGGNYTHHTSWLNGTEVGKFLYDIWRRHEEYFPGETLMIRVLGENGEVRYEINNGDDLIRAFTVRDQPPTATWTPSPTLTSTPTETLLPTATFTPTVTPTPGPSAQDKLDTLKRQAEELGCSVSQTGETLQVDCSE